MKINFLQKRFACLCWLAGLALMQVGCQITCQKMEPTLVCQLPSHRINSLPSAFPTLSPAEREQEWAKELLIGESFARECDFYRAITCFKRALILLPPCQTARHLQLDYNLMLCYYLGNKHQEAINIFESSELSQANPDFPAFNNLLLMVYDCYLQIKQEDKAACVLEIIRKFSPITADDLSLYQNLKEGQIESARCLMSQHRDAEAMEMDFAFYDQFAKSPKKARILNAVLPGAGYYYVGQRRSAMTSFIINTLFTAAAYQFFRRGYPAAGAITASLEMGWYVGGINGAGIEAHEFNTRLYEGISRKILNEHDGFPILMFETTF